IVCVNVANLLLVRATSRRHEAALRAALGATRRDLIGVAAAESLLIALGGTLAGLLFATWILGLLMGAAPPGLSGIREITVDGRVFGFALGVGLLCAMMFGLFPAWRFAKTAPIEGLRDAGRGSSGGSQGSRLRSLFVSAEVALGTVLLIGSGLLLA